MGRQDSTRLLEGLLKSEKQNQESFRAWSSDAAGSAASLNTWAIADNEVPELSDISMRVSALMMETADQQRDFGSAIGNFRESLRNLLERQKDVQTIVRDREILVNRTLRLSSKRPNDKDNEKHRAKLDEASRELGACEVALKQEEAALSGVKARTLQEALGMRLRAQEDLGMLYIETAREGLEMLTQLDMEAITSTVRSRPLSPIGSPIGSPVPDGFSPPQSPYQGATHGAHLPPTDDIPPMNGHEGGEAPDHTRQRTTSGARHSMAVPPTVPEDDRESEDSSAAEEAMITQNTTAHRNSAFGRGHKRGDSSDYGGTDTSKTKKKGGLFGSIGRLFKTREPSHDEEGTPTKKSSKKGGWATGIDRNITVQSALNEKAAKSERPWSPSRGRRNSDSSDEQDKRKLVKVVNKKRPQIWTADPTTDMSPPASTKGKSKTGSRKRSDSYSGTTPSFALPMSQTPRKAMSDSGLPDEPARPTKVKKKKAVAPGESNLSRSPSTATAGTVTTKKVKKQSAAPGQEGWRPKAHPGGMHHAPSLLSVVSDGDEPQHSSHRRYLTSPANDAINKPSVKRAKSTKSTTSTKTKQRPASMVETSRGEYGSHTGPTADLTTLALPSAAAFKHNSQNYSNQEEGEGLTTLHLPSASASRAYVAGSTLTLPSAPPPVSSTPHLVVPDRDQPPQKPQMKRSASSASASRTPTKAAPVRSHSSTGLRPEPALLERPPTQAPQQHQAAAPASSIRGRTESRPKPNGILHSPGGTVRSLSPDSTVSRRKSVRIHEGELPPSSSHRGIPDSYEEPALVDKGKTRASEAEIQGWSSGGRRRYTEDTSDEEEDDVLEYRAARKAMARKWDQPLEDEE